MWIIEVNFAGHQFTRVCLTAVAELPLQSARRCTGDRHSSATPAAAWGRRVPPPPAADQTRLDPDKDVGQRRRSIT